LKGKTEDRRGSKSMEISKRPTRGEDAPRYWNKSRNAGWVYCLGEKALRQNLNRGGGLSPHQKKDEKTTTRTDKRAWKSAGADP